MNGGIAVDIWGRSSHPAIYAVGEAAGTHGVTRPGGAALNAGQVLGTRAAEHIAARRGCGCRRTECPPRRSRGRSPRSAPWRTRTVPLSVRHVRDDVQARMSDAAGILCDAETVRTALSEARALNAAIRANGIAFGRPSEAGRAVQWQQMALASEAVLTALDHYISEGGGSRGARAILDPAGEGLPMSARGPLEDVRFRRERPEDREPADRRPPSRREVHPRRPAQSDDGPDGTPVLRAGLARVADGRDLRTPTRLSACAKADCRTQGQQLTHYGSFQ